ncbi:LysR family transcriptional regulator [Levilactobacillus enshiensis]|uniref:LysR family transcriptional regulator n=1 Tax=Levilactobacillus enshiensis TaxID=2590213 RepID=UPI00117A2DD6|nr:LysR family transcriptional regulator [Levilactobacillus enshiensis]
MQIQDLSLFQTMYTLRSINRTAQQRGYSQSNVSARLQALEDELQVKLFVRSYQGLTPTAAGAAFNAYAQEVLTATRKLHAQLNQQNSVTHIVISELLFDYLVVTQHKYDLAKQQFTIKKSTTLATTTHETAQLVITYANFNDPKYQVRDRGWLQASYAGREATLSGKPLLVNSDRACPFRRASLATAESKTVISEVDSWNGIVALVKAGEGVALLPQFLIQENRLVQLAGTASQRIPYWTFERNVE